MTQTIDVNLFYIAFICYTIAMLIYIFTFWKKAGKAVVSGRIILLIGFLFQVAGLVLRSVQARFMPVTNMYESLNFFSCVIVLAYLIVEKRSKNRSFGAFILPVAFLLMAFSSLVMVIGGLVVCISISLPLTFLTVSLFPVIIIFAYFLDMLIIIKACPSHVGMLHHLV